MIVVRIILAAFIAVGGAYLAGAELGWSLPNSIILGLMVMAVYGLTELELDLVVAKEEEQEEARSYLGVGD